MRSPPPPSTDRAQRAANRATRALLFTARHVAPRPGIAVAAIAVALGRLCKRTCPDLFENALTAAREAFERA